MLTLHFVLWSYISTYTPTKTKQGKPLNLAAHAEERLKKTGGRNWGRFVGNALTIITGRLFQATQ